MFFSYYYPFLLSILAFTRQSLISKFAFLTLSLANQYYRSCCAVLIVYDVAERSSFEHLEYWLNKVDENAGLNIKRLIVANKCDLSYKRMVSRAEGEEFARQNNLKYIETSSKLGKNVNTAFENLAFDVFWEIKNKKVIPDDDGSNGVKLGNLSADEQSLTSSQNLMLEKNNFTKSDSSNKTCCG